MNTSEIELSEDFECHYDLPATKCGATQKSFFEAEEGSACAVCQVIIFSKLGEDTESMQVGDDGGGDDEEDFVDDVTTQQSDMLTNWTPRQRMENEIMNDLDVLKGRINTSNNEALQAFGAWIHINRFELRDLYVVVQSQHNFFPIGVTRDMRTVVLVITYATYMNTQDIPEELFELTSLPRKKCMIQSEALYIEYTGKGESLILFYITNYARQLGYDEETTDLAKELWVSAEPIYVNANDSIRGLVWLILTHRKVTGEKINRAQVSRLTKVDPRTIKRVQDKYEPYFQ
jgi:hypothetical protein